MLASMAFRVSTSLRVPMQVAPRGRRLFDLRLLPTPQLFVNFSVFEHNKQLNTTLITIISF